MRSCYCPGCGANLHFEDDNREFAFCQYCGARIMLDDYRSMHRVVDEARIQENETNRIIRMRELDIEEREQARSRKGRTVAFIIALILGGIGVLSMVVAPNSIVGLMGIGLGGWIAIFAFINAEDSKKNVMMLVIHG